MNCFPLRQVTLGTLLALATTGPAFADALTIFAIPTPRGNDYSSPRRLAMSTNRNFNTGNIYPLGHAAFHLRCEAAGGGEAGIDIFDGINGLRLSDGEYLTRRRGYGLGVMFTILSGHFEGRATTIDRVQANMDSGSAVFIHFDVSTRACHRMAAFIEEYGALGIPDNYGLSLRPRYKEGANCATFVAALLEVGGLADQGLMDSWRVSLRVPEHLVGGPLTGRFVPSIFFFVRPLWARKWAGASEPHFYIEFYDPELLHHHIWNRWHRTQSPVDNGDMPAKITQNGITRGFIVDATSAPVPDEPFWGSH